MSLLGARRITDFEIEIPEAGGWIGSGHLDSGAKVAMGPVTVTIGDLKLVGAVLDQGRGGVDSPDHPAFVVAGGYGWRKQVTSGGAYANAAGVRLTDVLRDLATFAGESYVAPPEYLLGAAYGWDVSTPQKPVRGRAILAELVARGAIPTWRVDPLTGRTRFDAWPGIGAADAHGTVESRDLSDGVRNIAISGSVAAWLPGATVQGDTIARVTLTEADGELRLKAWNALAPRRTSSIRELVTALFPWAARFGLSVSKALQIRSASGRTEIEGPAGLLPLLRVGDVRGIVFDPGVPNTTAPALYYTANGGASFVRVAQVAAGSTVGGTVPPPTLTPSTQLAPTGSTRVTCG